MKFGKTQKGGWGKTQRVFGKTQRGVGKTQRGVGVNDFALYGSWEDLVACEMLLQGPSMIFPPGESKSEASVFFPN